LSWKEKFVNQITCGDSQLLIKEISSDSIDLVITSPPYYQQRNYGEGIGNEDTIKLYIAHLLNVFRESIRILKSTGNIVFNLGDKYIEKSLQLIPYRFALECLKEPVSLVNTILWSKSNPTPHQYDRRLINSYEPFFHFCKSNDYYYDRTAFMVKAVKKQKKSNEPSEAGMKYFAMIDSSSLTEVEKEHARSELTEAMQKIQAGTITGLRMKIRGIHAMAYGGQEGGRNTQILKNGFSIIKLKGEPLKRDVINFPVETIKGNKHPAVYPESLIEELLLLLTQKGDLVVDPFIGYGTTAVACQKLGRSFIGFDINADYCGYARERIAKVDIGSEIALPEEKEEDIIF
jgi:site-specific DNA-methyltransferase (adenine-specific)